MKLTIHTRQAFVAAAMQDVPSIDYQTQIQDYCNKAAVDAFPPLVKQAYAAHPDFFERSQHRIGTTWRYVPGPVNLTTEALTEADKLDALDKAQSDARVELRNKLAGVAGSVTTVAALLKLLPEFEKYLPKEGVALANPPAIANVISSFMAAGWPASKAVTA